MTAKEMLYEFELSADRVSSANAMNLPLAAKVAYLNRGQLAFVLNRYDGDKLKNKGFEETRRRTDELQSLVKTLVELKVKRLSPFIYVAELSQVADYMILLRRELEARNSECKGQRILKIIECQTDDLNERLSDPFTRPDFKWRRCLERTADGQLQYFTDGMFAIEKVRIDYLSKPQRIDVEGYIHFDGTPSSDVACALPAELTHNEIVALAALEFDWDLNNPGQQSKAAKLQLLG